MNLTPAAGLPTDKNLFDFKLVLTKNASFTVLIFDKDDFDDLVQ